MAANAGKDSQRPSRSHHGARAISLPSLDRRQWLKTTFGGGTGLALSSRVDVSKVRAVTENLKLSQTSEFTTSCNFCSCACGMIASVRKGKLMEGDYDHIVNRGSRCVKGTFMFATHPPRRLAKPLYRASGSVHWEEISWENAVETARADEKRARRCSA